MKTRIIIAALAIAASAVLTTATAKKKESKTSKAPAAAVIELKSSSDSVSFVAGYAQTNALIPYLQHQLNVDTAYMADFIQGLKEAKDKANDPRFKAYQAGTQIADMINNRMIPGIGATVKDTPDSLNAEFFYAGFIAALQNDTTKFNLDSASKLYTTRMEAAEKAKEEKAQAEGKAWLAANSTKEGVQTTASGLQYKVITMGTGAKPSATDEVEVKYEGKLIDGTVFDSSYTRNPQTSKFKANQVIKGWTEGLQLMPVGSKFEFYIPQELGYGARPSGQIPAYSTLIFTVELISITGK